MPINKFSRPSIALLSTRHKIFCYGVICKNTEKNSSRVLGASFFFKFFILKILHNFPKASKISLICTRKTFFPQKKPQFFCLKKEKVCQKQKHCLHAKLEK